MTWENTDQASFEDNVQLGFTEHKPTFHCHGGTSSLLLFFTTHYELNNMLVGQSEAIA